MNNGIPFLAAAGSKYKAHYPNSISNGYFIDPLQDYVIDSLLCSDSKRLLI